MWLHILYGVALSIAILLVGLVIWAAKKFVHSMIFCGEAD